MKIAEKNKYSSIAHVFKAISHPTRLFIIDKLSEGEKCVCELTELIGVDISTVSKHLALLKKAGIIEDEKRGQKVFYHLKMLCILRFIGCVESIVLEMSTEG